MPRCHSDVAKRYILFVHVLDFSSSHGGPTSLRMSK